MYATSSRNECSLCESTLLKLVGFIKFMSLTWIKGNTLLDSLLHLENMISIQVYCNCAVFCGTTKCITHKNFFLCLCSFLYRIFAAHVVVQFTLRLLHKELPSLSETDASHTLCRAFIFVCRQIYNTFEGLQVLRPYGLHKALAAEWKKVTTPHLCM